MVLNIRGHEQTPSEQMIPPEVSIGSWTNSNLLLLPCVTYLREAHHGQPLTHADSTAPCLSVQKLTVQHALWRVPHRYKRPFAGLFIDIKERVNSLFFFLNLP